MQLTEPHCSVMYQEDLKLENYAISVAHLPPGNRFVLCPVPDTFVASFMSSLCVMPSFCWKYCKQIKSKETPKPINFWAARWATLPWKHFGVDFLCSVSSYQAEILLKCCPWRCPPCSDDMEVKKLVTIFLSARLSSQGQFCSNKHPGRWQWGVTMVVACDMHFGNNFST